MGTIGWLPDLGGAATDSAQAASIFPDDQKKPASFFRQEKLRGENFCCLPCRLLLVRCWSNTHTTITTLAASTMWTTIAHHAAVPLLPLNATTGPVNLSPTINLGFPKSGTSSLYDYYTCGNVGSSHHKCKLETCGECVFANVEAGRAPLDSCGNYAFYGQLDIDGIGYDSEGSWPGDKHALCYFPQLSALQELHDAYPTARFTLTTRPPAHWLASVDGWGLRDRLVDCNLPGLPEGKGADDQELMTWFSSHLDTVREFVAANPSHGPLLEVDIEDDSTGQVLEEATGIVRRAPSRPPRVCARPVRAPT